MKFSELFEMPTYIASELPVSDVKVHIVSKDTLDREYTLIGQTKVGDRKVIGALKKDRSSAIIGPVAKRDDGVTSVEVTVTMSFHPADDLGEAGSDAIQVDTVVSTHEARGFGYGYALYKMLLDNGMTVVSDNIQYIGGKALWMKIVRRSGRDNHNVFVLRDGKFLRDKQGNVIRYDGSNIPDSEIWSTDKKSVSHYYTTLVARNR